MVTDVLTRWVKGCLSEEFDEKITLDILSGLPSEPSVEEWERAKLALQDLYHVYRYKNPCQASAFAALHRCIYQVYCEAYDRLDGITPQPPPPPKPQRKPRPKTPPPAPPVPAEPTPEQKMAALQAMIQGVGTPLGKEIDNDPFNR